MSTNPKSITQSPPEVSKSSSTDIDSFTPELRIVFDLVLQTNRIAFPGLFGTAESDRRSRYRSANRIRDEASDLDNRVLALRSQKTQQVRRELRTAKTQIEKVLQDFEYQVMNASADQYNTLMRKSESTIMAIVKANEPSDGYVTKSSDNTAYIPKIGDQVYVKGLGDKVATIVESPGDDETVLVVVQYGKLRIRVKTANLRVISNRELNASSASATMKKKGQQTRDSPSISETRTEEIPFGPAIQTSKNTVDLRGMRVEEASQYLDMAISSTDSRSVLFIIHGMGTGALKEGVYDMLKSNPRIAKFEQENPMNYGCTVAYIK
ncbi:unnamed protein product [Rhodiola kirilowii]